MRRSKPLKYGLLVVVLYAVTVAYLRFGASDRAGWGSACLLALLVTPVVLAWWRVREWLMGRAREAGEGMREARRERRARGPR
ncbi:hypothetical protein ACIGO6_39215 [Streptomyces sp. NPDC053750]|uniref:hypothetical protein n=1 Tax=Streptomyces sp. NPDC053750 TaxID=3365714 RepID=UPI0037CEA6EF